MLEFLCFDLLFKLLLFFSCKICVMNGWLSIIWSCAQTNLGFANAISLDLFREQAVCGYDQGDPGSEPRRACSSTFWCFGRNKIMRDDLVPGFFQRSYINHKHIDLLAQSENGTY